MTARRLRLRLRTRLLALLLLVLAPLVALEVVDVVVDRRDASDEAFERAAEIAGTGAASIRSLVDQTDVLLGVTNRLSDPTGPGCSSELDAALLPGSAVLNLYSIAGDGTVLCAARGSSASAEVGGSTWFRRTVERDGLAVTAPAVALDGAASMILSRPRTPRSGTTERAGGPGVVGASVDLQTLVAFTADVELPEDTVVQVLDAEGNLLARNVDSARYLMRPAPLFPRLEGRESGTVEGRGLDDIPRLYAFQRVDVGGESLYVTAGLSRATAFDQADRRLLVSLVVVAVLAVSVVVVALLAARSLVAGPIDRLRLAMNEFRRGDIDRRVGELGGPSEINELGEAFDELADQIAEQLATLQGLLRELDGASEAERQGIAAGIHDETLGNLSALAIRLQLVRRRATDEAQVAELDRALALLDTTSRQLRGLLFDLRPPSLDRIGLAATLRETIEVRLADEGTRWSVEGEPDPGTPEWAQLLLYRVAQQALANVREHASASEVSVRIGDDHGTAWIAVVDDGRGFDVEASQANPRPGHIGLRVMRDRARAVGGDVVITSTPGAGTTVEVRIPYRRRAEGEEISPRRG